VLAPQHRLMQHLPLVLKGDIWYPPPNYLAFRGGTMFCHLLNVFKCSPSPTRNSDRQLFFSPTQIFRDTPLVGSGFLKHILSCFFFLSIRAPFPDSLTCLKRSPPPVLPQVLFPLPPLFSLPLQATKNLPSSNVP